jgi:hypothetical protein
LSSPTCPAGHIDPANWNPIEFSPIGGTWKPISEKLSGYGFCVIQNSGQAACEPSVSSVTSNATLPVRPAKSNGCFG